MAAAQRRFIESVEDVWVMGDETRLVQVATNLLANALRYGGDSDVRIIVRRDGANAVLTVSDLGVGTAHAAARKIMIVDDNLDAARTTAELLSLLGHEVGVAHDGKSALALLRQPRPDVAILDIGLPDMDG